MADSDIEWLQGPDGSKGKVHNPMTGCDWASKGCDHCYAQTMAKRLKGMGSPKYQTDGDPRTSGPGFGVAMHEGVLTQPLSWRKGARIFSNSMGDLFHPKVTDEFIAKVFAVAALSRRHTYLMLTKRAPRMASLLSRPDFREAVAEHASDLIGSRSWRHWQLEVGDFTARRAGPVKQEGIFRIQNTLWTPPWPLPNVWLGVSVEDQDAAKARLGYLRKTPAAVLWVSAEPLVGPVDLGLQLPGRPNWGPAYPEPTSPAGMPVQDLAVNPPISWVVVGGESGAGARPMATEWMTSIRDQCDEAGVAFYLKQTGNVLAKEWGLADRHGRTPSQWPESFPRDYPRMREAAVA